MLFRDVALTSVTVAATSKRSEKVAALAALLAATPSPEVAATVSFGIGATTQGRIGVGWATIHDVRPDPAVAPTLTVTDVDRAIGEIASITGPGSVAARRERLHDLLRRATGPEQALIRSIIGGELRQGALDGVMTAAVAKAAGVTQREVQRAAMFAGSLPVAATAALGGGAAALAAIDLSPSQPVQPMLASPASDVTDALDSIGSASVEWKLDGARVQAHRHDGEVRLFTRNLNDVTHRLGGVVEFVSGLPGGDLVLDGEVLGVDDAGAPRRFQDTMGDFGADPQADAEVGRGGRGDGLRAFFFDVLHADRSVVDEALAVRRDVLAEVVPPSSRLPSIITTDPVEAQAFLDRAISAGHEGVMVKDLASRYDAGRRGRSWRKVKPVHTFDLVVLAAEWGHGRRQGWLSNLHLGAAGADGTFVMVGKTFKGLTDELLRWQTARFLELEIGRDGHTVHVRPEQVVEIAVDGVQVSTRYPGGVALRFARVRRYRDDKDAGAADTIDRVRDLLSR